MKEIHCVKQLTRPPLLLSPHTLKEILKPLCRKPMCLFLTHPHKDKPHELQLWRMMGMCLWSVMRRQEKTENQSAECRWYAVLLAQRE